MSDFSVIDVAFIEVATEKTTLFRAGDPPAFKTIALTGDAEPMEHPDYLRLKVTGIDPQLILPSLPGIQPNEIIRVKLRLLVSTPKPDQGA
jgi:hypothetical protein